MTSISCLKTFKGTCLSLQYSGNTSAKIKKQKLEIFMIYINNVDHSIRFSHEDVKDNRLAILASELFGSAALMCYVALLRLMSPDVGW